MDKLEKYSGGNESSLIALARILDPRSRNYFIHDGDILWKFASLPILTTGGETYSGEIRKVTLLEKLLEENSADFSENEEVIMSLRVPSNGGRGVEPFEWCKNNAEQFPHIKKLARDLLARDLLAIRNLPFASKS